MGRSRVLLAALTGIDVSTGLLAGVRGCAARKLEKTFLPWLRELLSGAPVLHVDETTGRAAGSLSYVHVACTEYLTLMHVGGRSSDDIDAGGVLPEFTGILIRDGYSGYAHLPAVHAWCGARWLRRRRPFWGYRGLRPVLAIRPVTPEIVHPDRAILYRWYKPRRLSMRVRRLPRWSDRGACQVPHHHGQKCLCV